MALSRVVRQIEATPARLSGHSSFSIASSKAASRPGTEGSPV